jgi:hypothetical protein
MTFGRALALTLLVASGKVALAGNDGHAVLRCDPALWIKSIDDNKKLRVSRADSIEDCNVNLTPGRHSLEVAFEWNQSEAALFEATWSSHENLTVEFDALADRIYRLKGELVPTWKAWVSDVTADEAALIDLPLAPKRKSKTESPAIVVARLAPRNVVVLSYAGKTSGPWFRAAYFKGLYIDKVAQPSTDLAFIELDDASNLGMIGATVNGNAISLDKQRGKLCGETTAPVFENLRGGRVYYLGRLDFSVVPSGLAFTLTQADIETTRQQLRSMRPEIAAAVEPASFRMARMRIPCEAVKTGESWTNRTIEKSSALNPGGASAGSK